MDSRRDDRDFSKVAVIIVEGRWEISRVIVFSGIVRKD